MNKNEKASQLLEMLDQVRTIYRQAQDEMLTAKDKYEQAERLYKEERVIALGRVNGKNSEARESMVALDRDVQALKAITEAAKTEFNDRYRRYKIAEADLLYIRDATALLRELS